MSGAGDNDVQSKSSYRGVLNSLNICRREPGCREVSFPSTVPFLKVLRQSDAQTVRSNHARACF